jgi:hypothetical protein
MDLSWPERRGSHLVWVRCRAVAWCSSRGGEPGTIEQQLCKPARWGFGRPEVLLLDRGMEKPYTI